MRKILGIIVAILGIVLGIYVGIYLLLAGGIFQVVEAYKNNWEISGIIWGAIRIICFGAGWIVAYIGIILGSWIGLKD